MVLPALVHPPLFAELHGGGRAVALRFVRGRYREGERVFGGIDEPNDVMFSPGPAMRYAKGEPRRIRVYHNGQRLGTWRVPGAKIVAWWNLPIVVQDGHVDLLRSGGRLRRLPISGRFLKTVLPGSSGALFALYSTKSHWRILRRGQDGDRWMPWMSGPVDGVASTRERLFVSIGDDGFGAFGHEELWRYDYHPGTVDQLWKGPSLATIGFDSPWVRPDHLVSFLYTHPWGHSSINYPYRTDLARLTDRLVPLASVPSGWLVYAFDPSARAFLGLHDNRRNFGTDLRRVRLGTMRETQVVDDVDALDVSTESPYSPLVDG